MTSPNNAGAFRGLNLGPDFQETVKRAEHGVSWPTATVILHFFHTNA
jgi:hypothetical protein